MTLVLNYSPAGAYTNPPTLADAVSRLRQDLFDRLQNVPAGAAQRWADDDLTRALDRAVDDYSFVAPLVQAVMTNTLPQTRAYALPAGAWWVETVEYPTGQWPPQFVDFEDNVVTPSLMPVGATAAAVGPGTGLTGSYQWGCTFVKSGGETQVGPLSAPLVLANQAAALTIPLGPPGTVGRNVYRYKAGLVQGFVAQVLDNLTTTYSDSLADGAVGGAPPSQDTTANLQQFVLKMSQTLVPADTTGVLTVTYALKHQLSTAGTSIPERHHDTVILGAAAYAILAYQVPQNDLFEYQDGELRDRVDERGIPAAWLAAGQRAMNEFKERLDFIRHERDAGAGAIARWGDEPLRWQRT